MACVVMEPALGDPAAKRLFSCLVVPTAPQAWGFYYRPCPTERPGLDRTLAGASSTDVRQQAPGNKPASILLVIQTDDAAVLKLDDSRLLMPGNQKGGQPFHER